MPATLRSSRNPTGTNALADPASDAPAKTERILKYRSDAWYQETMGRKAAQRVKQYRAQHSPDSKMGQAATDRARRSRPDARSSPINPLKSQCADSRSGEVRGRSVPTKAPAEIDRLRRLMSPGPTEAHMNHKSSTTLPLEKVKPAVTTKSPKMAKASSRSTPSSKRDAVERSAKGRSSSKRSSSKAAGKNAEYGTGGLNNKNEHQNVAEIAAVEPAAEEPDSSQWSPEMKAIATLDLCSAELYKVIDRFESIAKSKEALVGSDETLHVVLGNRLVEEMEKGGKQYVQELFRTLDVNGDGTATRIEFKQLMVSAVCRDRTHCRSCMAAQGRLERPMRLVTVSPLVCARVCILRSASSSCSAKSPNGIQRQWTLSSPSSMAMVLVSWI